MNNKELNRLAVYYQKTRDGETFRRIYELISKDWRKTNAMDKLSAKYRLDKEEVRSLSWESILRFLHDEKYDPGTSNFIAVTSRIISDRCVDERRRQERYEREGTIEMTNSTDEGEEFTILDIVEDNEEDYGNFEKKSDQRQLIAELMSKANEKCRQALDALAQSDNFYDAGKRLGIRNVTVENRIRKIADHFDYGKWGDIADYLTESGTEDDFIYAYKPVEQSDEFANISESPVYTYYI